MRALFYCFPDTRVKAIMRQRLSLSDTCIYIIVLYNLYTWFDPRLRFNYLTSFEH